MTQSTLKIIQEENNLTLLFMGKLSLHTITKNQTYIDTIDISSTQNIKIDLQNVNYLDTATAMFLNNLHTHFLSHNIQIEIVTKSEDILHTLKLVQRDYIKNKDIKPPQKRGMLYQFGKYLHNSLLAVFSFIHFLGMVFATQIYYFKSLKNIRFKEIAFEINESGIKALGIVSLTSFLIGLVIAYQSAYQLKLYGANIFIVDMVGISILRELAPLITAIVIAGRSGSAFTAQIGAMKITEELDAMRTMGFDPYIFLVMPRIIALMIMLPILIFVADIMGILGGMLVANIDLHITVQLFMERFNEVVEVKQFYIGILKGPFFAFLIASIAIYRGLMVQNNTQSIGFNTTKSVVEAIFAVIVCDAIFSIVFTNLGI